MEKVVSGEREEEVEEILGVRGVFELAWIRHCGEV